MNGWLRWNIVIRRAFEQTIYNITIDFVLRWCQTPITSGQIHLKISILTTFIKVNLCCQLATNTFFLVASFLTLTNSSYMCMYKSIMWHSIERFIRISGAFIIFLHISYVQVTLIYSSGCKSVASAGETMSRVFFVFYPIITCSRRTATNYCMERS